MNTVIYSLGAFWRLHPALLYALSALLGLHAALHWNALLLIPFFTLFFPLLIGFKISHERLRSRLGIALLFMLASYSYVSAVYQFPELPEEGIEGLGHLRISSVKAVKTAFHSGWKYSGTIRSFRAEAGKPSIAQGIPVSVSMPIKEKMNRPLANCDYLVFGTLMLTDSGQYILSTNPEDPWRPIPGTWSLVEIRYQAKAWLKGYLVSRIKGMRAANFLSGIATGEFDDKIIQFEFSRFGLQHIMAVSGFHFGIIAAMLNLFFRCALSRKQTAVLMILALTAYFIFLGCSASIMRAWITIIVVFVAGLLNKKSSALNTLGVALLVIFFADPLQCRTIGFELSFLSTAAILFFFLGCDLLMQKVWLKRPLSHAVQMDRGSQHAILALSFLRQAIALTIAVHLVALPMMLFYFQKFPVMSLLYNLFFPFLVSISMLLLLLGLFCELLLPPAAALMHAANTHYTQFVLNLAFNMPPAVDLFWQSALSEAFVVIYLCCLLCGGIWLKSYLQQRRNELEDLTFL